MFEQVTEGFHEMGIMCTTEIGVLGGVLVFIQLLSVSRFTKLE